MLEIIMTVVGAVIFVGGYIFMIKSQKEKTGMKLLSIITYLGLAICMMGGIRLLTPVFQMLSGKLSNIAMVVVELAVFIIGGEYIVHPAFAEEKPNEPKSKNISKYGSGKKNKKKKK